jgi:YVTN family beta-propeller protein
VRRLQLILCLTTLALAAACATAARASEPPPGAALIAKYAVPNTGNVTAGFGALWVGDGFDNAVEKVDPGTGAIVAAITVGNGAFGVIRAGERAVWIANAGDNTVSKIDPGTNTVVATIDVGLLPEGIAVTPGAVWVANHHSESVSRIDPATNTVVDTILVGDPSLFAGGPAFIGTAAGSVWVDVPNLDAVVRIDASTDQVVATIPVKGPCGEVLGTASTVWVAGGGCSTGITRIDTATNAAIGDKVNAGGKTIGLTTGFESVWFTTLLTGFLAQADPANGAILSQLKLGPKFSTFGVAGGFGSLWVADGNGSLLQIQPS